MYDFSERQHAMRLHIRKDGESTWIVGLSTLWTR
jgi:hypothetical protein